MSEVLNPEEFANFQDHLRAHRDLVSEGGTIEPDDEMVRILSMQQGILLASDITGAAELLRLNPLALSESARGWGMTKPYVAVKKGDF